MKKLLSFLVFAFMLVACGNYVPKAGDAPEVVVKKCLDMYFTGEINQAKQSAKCIRFESEDKKKKFIEFMETKVRSNQRAGGIKSLETKLLYSIGDIAVVKVLGTFKNGDSFDQNVDLIKINDTWYFKNL